MVESQLYSFSQETEKKLRKFRLGTSRNKDMQAIIYIIDQKTQEIRPADEDPADKEQAEKNDTIYSNLEDLVEDLPGSSPRFILLSYPFTTKDDRLSVPYVLLYWLPRTCNDKQRMSYAGAKELMRNTAEVQRVIEVVGENDDEDAIAETVDDIKMELTGSD